MGGSMDRPQFRGEAVADRILSEGGVGRRLAVAAEDSVFVLCAKSVGIGRVPSRRGVNALSFAHVTFSSMWCS
jgi:hypothetical protein